MLSNIVLIFVSLILFNLLIFFYIKIAFRYKIVSVPKRRDSHHSIKPKGAGIIIYTIILLYLFLNYFFYNQSELNLIILYSTILITLFSFIDDIYDVNWKYKIIIDLCTSLIIIYFFKDNLFNLISISNYLFFFIPILILIIAWFINLINFSDGSDGYLTFLTILLFATNILIKLLFQIEISYINILIIIILINFLYYNFLKSVIFLGDSGSRLISILIITNIFYDYFNYNVVLIYIWILSLLIVLTDTGLTLLQKIIIDKKILQEHKDHAYQIIANKFGHKISLIWLIFNFTIFVIPSIYLQLYSDISFIIILSNLFVLFVIQIIFIKVKYKL